MLILEEIKTMRKELKEIFIHGCNEKIEKKGDNVGLSFYAFFKNKNDNPELLMEAANWWIMQLDILPDLKDGDSSSETLMSECKNIKCRVYIPIMERTALHTLPFSYSKSCSTFRTTTA